MRIRFLNSVRSNFFSLCIFSYFWAKEINPKSVLKIDNKPPNSIFPIKNKTVCLLYNHFLWECA